jgi:hypothetical protein
MADERERDEIVKAAHQEVTSFRQGMTIRRSVDTIWLY